MQRIALQARPDWQQQVEEAGLTFHSPEDLAAQGRTYWDETAAYQFTAAEIDRLEAAGNELQEMCLAAAQHVIDRGRWAEMGISAEAAPVIEAAWNAEPPSLYGRFDLSWAGESSGQAPRLLEYNADTPTSLIEAAVIQWTWLEQVGPRIAEAEDRASGRSDGPPDQFNSIHDALVAKWKDLDPYLAKPVYFAGLDVPEDALTLAYLMDTAQQAGLETSAIPLEQVGWNDDRHQFVDHAPEENAIQSIFKLYPWELMLHEEFGQHALDIYGAMHWIEPVWKLLLSNKGILPILWELNPGHELLLEAHFDDGSGRAPAFRSGYVRKPLFSREGANIRMVYPDGRTVETGGDYGDGPAIVQALAPDATFYDAQNKPRYPVLGLWMVDQACTGMGIRESVGPITDNLSSFVPHLFR